MGFVTLEEASDHLRRDTTDDDADLQLKIDAASAAIERYLKDTSPYVMADGEPVLIDGNPVVLFEVKAATLLLIGELYRNRDGEQQGEVNAQFGYGFLPRPVVALLYPLRVPSMA